MAHRTPHSSYQKLTSRLNLYPQGATPSGLLYRILSLLFSEQEAELVAALPIKPFTAEQAAKNWRVSLAEAKKALESLTDMRTREGSELAVNINECLDSLITITKTVDGKFYRLLSHQ